MFAFTIETSFRECKEGKECADCKSKREKREKKEKKFQDLGRESQMKMTKDSKFFKECIFKQQYSLWSESEIDLTKIKDTTKQVQDMMAKVDD